MSRKIKSGPLKGKSIERGIYLNDGYVYVRIFTDGVESKTYIGPDSEAGILDKAHIELDRMKGLRRAGKLGQEVKEVRWTVEKLADAYWEEEGKKKPSHVTINSMLNFFKEIYACEYVDAVNFTHTIALRGALAKKGLKASSVNRYHTCWRRMFYFLVEMKRVKAHGFANVKLPEFNPGTPVKSRAETHITNEKSLRRRRVVTPAEFVHFCKFASDAVKKICYLAVQTTLRRKDLFSAIKEKNVSGQGVQSKTGQEYDIPFPEEVKKIISEGVVIKNFRREFEAARAASGLEYFQFRDLRKSLPSILREGNYDIKKISEILGHSDVAMTMVYLPVKDAEKQKAMTEASASFTITQAAVNQ